MSWPLTFFLQTLNEEGGRAGTLQEQVCPGSWAAMTVLSILGELEDCNGRSACGLQVCAFMASFSQFPLLEFSKPNKNFLWPNTESKCAAFIITEHLPTITSCSSSCLLLCSENPPRHWRLWKKWRGNWRQPPPWKTPQPREWGMYRPYDVIAATSASCLESGQRT